MLDVERIEYRSVNFLPIRNKRQKAPDAILVIDNSSIYIRTRLSIERHFWRDQLGDDGSVIGKIYKRSIILNFEDKC